MADSQRTDTNGFNLNSNHILLNTLQSGLMPKFAHNTLEKYLHFESKYGAYETQSQLAQKFEEGKLLFSKFLSASVENIRFLNSIQDFYPILSEICSLSTGNTIVYHLSTDSPLYKLISSLARLKGLKLSPLHCKSEGSIIVSDIEKQLKRSSILLCVEAISIKEGIQHPLPQICKAARKKKVPILVDGSYILGQDLINLKKAKYDFFIANTQYYIGGPQGTYLSYISDKHRKYLEYIHEDNAFLKMGLSAAVSYHLKQNQGYIKEQLHYLSHLIRYKLADSKQIRLIVPKKNPANHVPFYLDDGNEEELYHSLRQNSDKPPIYLAGHFPEDSKEQNLLIVSPNYYITEKEIDIFCRQLRSFL